MKSEEDRPLPTSKKSIKSVGIGLLKKDKHGATSPFTSSSSLTTSGHSDSSSEPDFSRERSDSRKCRFATVAKALQLHLDEILQLELDFMLNKILAYNFNNWLIDKTLKGKLVVANHGLEFIPEELFALHKDLTSLDLTDNKIASIPKQIVKLSRLERLDLGYNHFRNDDGLCGEVSSLPSLQYLLLNGNQFSEIPPVISKVNILTNTR